MFKKIILLLLVLWLNGILIAADFVNFDEIKNHVGKQIQTRGFIYSINEDWVLSNKPNLKSCCISKQNNTIFLIGNLENVSKGAIDIEGVVVSQLLINGDTRYLLNDVQLKRRSSNGFRINDFRFFLSAFVLVLLIFGMNRALK